MKTEPNDSINPQLESRESIGETLWIDQYTTGGLTKREHFAGLAMQALLSNPRVVEQMGKYDHLINDEKHVAIAKMAILNADALIAELNK